MTGQPTLTLKIGSPLRNKVFNKALLSETNGS